MAIPVFGSNQVPAQVKVGMVGMTALLLFPMMTSYTQGLEFTMPQFGLIVIHEALLGVLLAITVNLIFIAIQIGGTIIGYKMGFAAANVFDPQSTSQLPLISQFFNVFALLIFFSVGAHNVFFQTIVQSYELLPPGYFNFSGDVFLQLNDFVRKMFVLGVKLSAPILAVLILTTLSLGIMARVFPQLNVFLLSFPLNIGVSFLVISISLSTMYVLLSQEFDMIPKRLFSLIALL
jgi:flagellar biosynthetic protein FliR